MTKRNEIGRPPVLGEIKKREICAILHVGCSRVTAAQYVGCHPNTIRNTALRDEQFALDLERAESMHELKHLANINQAAQDARYWRAAAWALERRYPGRYGPRNPKMFTLEQVSQVLEQFAGVVLAEVPEEAHRDRILERLSDLTLKLQSGAAAGGDA